MPGKPITNFCTEKWRTTPAIVRRRYETFCLAVGGGGNGFNCPGKKSGGQNRIPAGLLGSFWLAQHSREPVLVRPTSLLAKRWLSPQELHRAASSCPGYPLECLSNSL